MLKRATASCSLPFWITAVLGLVVSFAVNAMDPPESMTSEDLFELSPVPGYVARIRLNNPAEVDELLKKAEAFYIENQFANNLPPIVFVLHGPETEIFNRNNYSKHKETVDLAARLQAFKVIDIRVCETRMSLMNEQQENLYPFVGTVPFGPAEIDRLLNKQDYVYF